MKNPSDAEIEAAERRIEKAERDLASGKKRAKAAIVDFLVKPVTLLGIGIAACALGYYAFKKPPPVPDDWRAKLSKMTRGWIPQRAPTQAETAATAAASTGIMGIVVALAMKYATSQLPGIGYRLLEQSLRKRGAFTPSSDGKTVTLH